MMQERSVHQAHTFERLIRGQTSICIALEELQRSVDRLPGLMMRANSVRSGVEDPSPTVGGGLSPVPLIPNGVSERVLLHQQSGLEGRISFRHSQSGVANSSSAIDQFTTHNTFLERRGSDKLQVYRPQQVYHEMHQGMVRTNYSHLAELARKHFLDKKRELSRSMSFAAEQKAGWTAPVALNSIILHPASKRRGIFDCLIVVFLMLDAIIVPYAIAWDVNDELWLSFLSWIVAMFWSLDVLLSFCTGYIKGNNVEMGWRSIAVKYLRGGFSMDFLVLIVEYINLLAANYMESFTDRSSLRIVKVLRFFKITRLVRVLARLRAGLVNRMETKIAYWIQFYKLHGWEHYINFAQILLKLFFIIAWLSHIGSCIWYSTQQAVSSGGEPTWYNDLLDTGTWEEDHMYMQGFYWAVSTMFSGSSYVAPNNVTEASYSMTWLVMGALFVTSITSTLAAKVIETQEKTAEAMIKMRTLNVYMGQRKTPVLLALAIQNNFNEALTKPVQLTELDLPFLDKVSNPFRASLREHHYAPGLYHLTIIRILHILQDDSLKLLSYQAAHFNLAKEGEELFGARQNQTVAIMLTEGTVQYVHMRNGTSQSTEPMQPRDPDTPCGNLGPDFLTKLTVQTVHEAELLDKGRCHWLCELALLLDWETVGSAECKGDCELLTISAENFLKVVSQSPVMSAVVCSFAAGVCEALDQNIKHEREPPTDVSPGVDFDIVVANLHMAVRSDLVSLPIIDLLRRQQNVLTGLVRRKPITDLEDEVVAGKCHLIMADPRQTKGQASELRQEVCRVCRLVVLRILNAEGLICTQLAEKRGEAYSVKFNLPARKVDGNANPQETIQKLLDDDYKMFLPFIKLDKVDMQIEEEYSASYGLRTKYIKFVQTVVLEHAYMDPCGGRSVDHNISEAPPFIGSRTLSGMARLGPYSTINQVFPKKSAASDAFQESLGVILHGPFNVEGSQHSFALCEGQRASHDHIKFYKWLLPTDFETLHARRSEVESALEQHLYSGLSQERLERLTSWDLKYMVDAPYRSDRGSLSPDVYRSEKGRLTIESLRTAGEPQRQHTLTWDYENNNDDEVWGAAV